MAKDSGITNEIKNWPDAMKEDTEIKTAFSYLKGFKMFGPGKSKG
jgi:hypothetical protein